MGSPALMDAQSGRILDFLNDAISYLNNNVHGGVISDGGTTQASGANTHPNVDIDITDIVDAAVDGTAIYLAGAADIDPNAGDQVDFDAITGKSAVGTVILKNDGTLEIVFGAVATTGAQVAATDAEIDTYLANAAVKWVRVAEFTINRTGDTTITVTAISMIVRPHVPKYDALAVTEEQFANQDFTRLYPITH